MPYRHSYGGGLRFMDYPAASVGDLLFPSDGRGGVTTTFDGCDIDGYVPSIHHIICISPAFAGETQDLTIETPAGTVLQTTTMDGDAEPDSGDAWLPIMQEGTTVRGPAPPGNTSTMNAAMEIPGGFGIRIEDKTFDTAEVRVWYSRV